jgi:hypothetical protein
MRLALAAFALALCGCTISAREAGDVGGRSDASAVMGDTGGFASADIGHPDSGVQPGEPDTGVQPDSPDTGVLPGNPDSGSQPGRDAGVTIGKDGITWTFSAPVVAGQFVNGDWWVVGPVTVTAIDPAPGTSDPFLNGSVKNLPTADGKSAFDKRLNDGVDESGWFNDKERAYPPLSLKAGDALVSSISLPVGQEHSLPEIMRASDKNCSPVKSVSVLTILASAPAADAFRPSYCDRTQALHRASELHRELLPSLAKPNANGTPALAVFEGYFRRPWIDTDAFLFDVPGEYMPSYGQHVAFAVAYASLLLTLDFPAADKETLTNYLVQYGIDLYGCVEAGYGWPAFGGHRSGRKLPVILAGLLLEDQAMKDVSKTYPNQFGEDMQTVYVNQIPGGYTKAWQGATVIYGGHYGVDQSTGKPTSADGLYGPYEQLQPKDWAILDPPKEQLGEAYRRCCTSIAWVGEALSIRLLNATDVWGHQAFFDYVDRWMTEDDTQAVADILSQSGYDYSSDWERQGQTRYWLQGEVPQASFVDDMWKAYR